MTHDETLRDVGPDPHGTTWSIVISFIPDTPDPSRVFRSMARLVDGFSALDRDLAIVVSARLRTVQLLHDIQPGSLRVWLTTLIEQVPDEALRDMNWRPLVGQYLVKVKHVALRWLNDRNRLDSAEELVPLESEIRQLAEATEVLQIPSYGTIPRRSLLRDLAQLVEAAAELNEDDSVRYIGQGQDSELNRRFLLLPADIDRLSAAESLLSNEVLVLQVKKPDYLGDSMWEFRYDGQRVDCKLLDGAWLARFHAREETVRPGDALRARVQVEVLRSSAGDVLVKHYQIVEVLGVIPAESLEQTSLLDRTHNG